MEINDYHQFTGGLNEIQLFDVIGKRSVSFSRLCPSYFWVFQVKAFFKTFFPFNLPPFFRWFKKNNIINFKLFSAFSPLYFLKGKRESAKWTSRKQVDPVC